MTTTKRTKQAESEMILNGERELLRDDARRGGIFEVFTKEY